MKKSILLRKLLLLVCLIFGLTGTTQTINTEWATKINQTFAGIDKNRVPHGLLRDYAMEFTDLAAYNGVLTDTSYVTKGTLTSVYNTLLMARVKPNVPGLISPTLYNQNWNSLREEKTIVLSGLYYKYSQFKSNAYPNFITISNDKLFDKYVKGVWQNPYEEKQVFAISPPIVKYKGLKTTVKLPSSLWYTNQSSSVQSIAIDFDNGVGYVSIPFNGTYVLQYTQEGIKNWKFRMTLTNGQVLYSHSRMIFEKTLYDTTATTLLRTINQPCSQNEFGIDQVEFEGTQFYLGVRNTATLEIDYADDDCLLKKPLIVAEGFDSGLLGVENGLGDNDFEDFINDATILSGNLSDEITNYDIIYVNWDKGRDHLQRNALLLQDIIQWVNNQKALAGSTEKNVVLGQSMGGVIARYALADMEQRSLIHDTKLYISHDAPHQGANIPLGIQYFARHLADQFVGTPLGDYSFEVSNGNSASIEDLNALLNAPGTQQLLSNYIKSDFAFDTSSMNDAWQEDLLNKGYPTQTRNIAISNGSHCANTQDYEYNASLFRMNGNAKTGVLADILGLLLGISDDIALAIVFDEPALLLGTLPGSSKFNLDFNAKALPVANQTKNIYKGKISYTKKFLWIGNITVNLTDRSYNNPVNLSFDKYGGGRYELFDDINGINFFDDIDYNGDGEPDITQFQADLLNALVGSANIDFNVEQTFGFIPTPSALDVGSGNVVLNDSDYFRIYSSANPPTGDRAIPFHNFITAFENNSINEQHISFNTRNGDWLATEIDIDINNSQVFDCSFICDDKSNNIFGINLICNSNTATFNAPTGGAFYNWQIIDGSNLIASSSGSNTQNFTITTLSTGYGRIKLQVTMGDDPNNTGNGRCGNAIFTKNIWVGKPYVFGANPNPYELEYFLDGTTCPFESTTLCAGNYGEVNSRTICVVGLDTSSQWEIVKLSGYFSYSHYNGIITINPSVPGALSFKVRVTNSCGISDWKTFTYTAINCNPSMALTTVETSTYVVYPNPSNAIVYIDLSDPANNPTTDDSVQGELYDFMGLLKANVEIINGNSSFDVSGLAKGVYVLRIYVNGQVESHLIGVE